MVTFLFSVQNIIEAKQYAGLGRAEPGLEPGRWIFQPGQMTWRAPAPPLPISRIYRVCSNEKRSTAFSL